MDERFSGRQAGVHGQSKLRLVRYRGEVKMTCATPAKLMLCLAMDVWIPSCSNLGNADHVSRAPRHLPLATGKRWRLQPGSGWTGGLAGCQMAGVQIASSRIRKSTRGRGGRDGQARASRGRGSSLWMLGRGGMISESKVGAHVVPASRPLRMLAEAPGQGGLGVREQTAAPPTPPPPPWTCSVASTCTEEGASSPDC